MQIVKFECKKALTSPIILFLLLLFTAYNILIVSNSSDFNKELHVANDVANSYGVEITDETLLKMEKDLQEELTHLNNITEEKAGQSFSSAGEFFSQLTYERQEKYSEDQLDSFYTIYLKEMYLDTAKHIDESYQKIDIKELGENNIQNYGLSGAASESLSKQYEKFGNRFDEMKRNMEHKRWFFAGKVYSMHSQLFKQLFLPIIFESIILIVLSTALITNYEFENKAHLVTYATKRGRRLMVDKLVASLAVSTILSVVLLAVALIVYFKVFDYTHLWHSSISSAFNWETNFPYVSWWEMSFLQYLVGAIALFYICMLLFSCSTFAIAVLLKNSYFTFFGFIAIFTILFMLQGFMPKSSNLIFVTGFNLTSLVLNPHQWFMASNGLLVFKYYEVITVLVAVVVITILFVFVMKRFNKQDIV
ncbi:ABC transporter permease [Ornithinibacillus californiensis]|uniref:ABC transporter permease n=1 Tax=Ornithinibacillus californiensis TaxID=161536 RepID=UPI00064D84AA|nr:ABC transporter permease [Ornithinibacillus californiensis]